MNDNHKHSSGRTSYTCKGFTLIELLIGVGIIGILSSIVLVAINPSKQLADAYDADRKNNVRNYGIAINKYVIDNWERPSSIRQLPSSEEDAIPICKSDIINNQDCVNLDVLVTDYLLEIPVDILADEDGDETGYAIYETTGQRPVAVALFLGVSSNPEITPPPPISSSSSSSYSNSSNSSSYYYNNSSSSYSSSNNPSSYSSSSNNSSSSPD